MASYNNLAPTQVKYGNGSEGAWNDPISSSGGTFAFGRSGQGHFVTFMIFKLPTSVSNITKIELTLYAHGTVSGTHTTIAKLVKNGHGPSNTSNPANWYSYPGLSTSDSVSASYSSSLSKRTYIFSSGLSTLTGGETIWVWLQGNSSSSYSEGRWSSGYPIYLNITYGSTTPTNYHITYYRNFSTSDSTTYNGGTVASGTYYPLIDCPWSRSGYSFNGWATSRSASSGHDAGTSVMASSNQIWYATWIQNVTQYTVKFYPGDHATVSNTSANAISRTYTEGGSLTLLSNTAFTGESDYTYYTTKYYLQGGDITSYNYPSSSSSYTRSGSSSNYCYSVRDDKKSSYSYEYWYGSDTSGVRRCGDTYGNLSGNINMWPYWSETVNYNAYFNPPNASRTGYRLSGWATNPTGTPNYQSGTKYQQSSNQNLYAIWEPNQVYINYYTDNDTAQAGDSRQGPYDVGDTVRLSGGSGWTSSKWGSSVTFYTNYNFQGGSFSNGVTPNSTYSVSRTGKYDWVISGWSSRSGGSKDYDLNKWITLNSNIGVYPYWADSDSIVSHAAFTPIAPIRTGYKFLNWNTQSSGNGTAYYAGTNYNTSAIDKNLTLYAIWEPEWTIKINNGISWGDYHVWIYTGVTSNNGWRQAIPYVYDGSNWKLTKI